MVCLEEVVRLYYLMPAGFLYIAARNQKIGGRCTVWRSFLFPLCVESRCVPLPNRVVNKVLKMQDIRFKLRIKITAKKMGWTNVRYLLYYCHIF
jgi:hypothetical protein